MPKRIQRKRTKGWRMPPNTVYVGRPSKWGNPFLGPEAADRYREVLLNPCDDNELKWIAAGGNPIVYIWLAYNTRHPALNELRGKDLVCWCSLEKECHADVLLEICNK